MAEITETRTHDPYGGLEYRVEWEDNEGRLKERFFKSHEAAERYSLEIELKLLNEVVRSFTTA